MLSGNSKWMTIVGLIALDVIFKGVGDVEIQALVMTRNLGLSSVQADSVQKDTKNKLM